MIDLKSLKWFHCFFNRSIQILFKNYNKNDKILKSISKNVYNEEFEFLKFSELKDLKDIDPCIILDYERILLLYCEFC